MQFLHCLPSNVRCSGASQHGLKSVKLWPVIDKTVWKQLNVPHFLIEEVWRTQLCVPAPGPLYYCTADIFSVDTWIQSDVSWQQWDNIRQNHWSKRSIRARVFPRLIPQALVTSVMQSEVAADSCAQGNSAWSVGSLGVRPLSADQRLQRCSCKHQGHPRRGLVHSLICSNSGTSTLFEYLSSVYDHSFNNSGAQHLGYVRCRHPEGDYLQQSMQR